MKEKYKPGTELKNSAGTIEIVMDTNDIIFTKNKINGTVFIFTRNELDEMKYKPIEKLTPKKGSIVNVRCGINNPRIRISMGFMNAGQDRLMCYDDGQYSGDGTGWPIWELIKEAE